MENQKRYDIFFDVGHTLCWSYLQGMAEMATKILGKTITQAELARGDRTARRAINRDVLKDGHASTMPRIANEMPSSIGTYYRNMIVHGLDPVPSDNPFRIDERYWNDVFPAWWEYQRTENWFTVLGLEVEHALHLLKEDGWRLGIISNSEGRIHELLTKVGIRRYFDVLIDSGIVGVAKPDPAIFRLAMERAGVEPKRSLYIGDQPDVDVKAALAVGMNVIHYDPQGVFADFTADGVPRCTNLLTVADGSLLRQIPERLAKDL